MFYISINLGLWVILLPRSIRGPFDSLAVPVVDAFSRDLVICDVPEMRDRLVEKPVATLLARAQPFEITRSRRPSSKPGLYKCVIVRARARAIYEGIESHKPEAFSQIPRSHARSRLNVNDKSATSVRAMIDVPPDGRLRVTTALFLTGAVKVPA